MFKSLKSHKNFQTCKNTSVQENRKLSFTVIAYKKDINEKFLLLMTQLIMPCELPSRFIT